METSVTFFPAPDVLLGVLLKVEETQHDAMTKNDLHVG